RMDDRTLIEESEACFHPDGKVDARWFGGSTANPGEGIEDTTSYRLDGGKLVFGGVAGWIQAYKLVCNAVIAPGRELRLTSCVDVGVDTYGNRQNTPEPDRRFKAVRGLTDVIHE